MSTSTFTRLFKDQAAKYVQFRPSYPPELYQTILEFANLPERDLCVDIATGQGQAAGHLSDVFKHVIGIDGSKEQLAYAVEKPNIEYRVADAHTTGLDDSSVDLVTVAQAMHWFELDVFYKEAARILKPTGCLAAWGYGIQTFPSFPEATKALDDLFDVKLGPYWSDRRKLVERHYHGDEPSGDVFSEVRHAPLMQVRMETSISQVVGYVTSWSSYTTYCKQFPEEGPRLIASFTAQLQRAFRTDDNDAPLEMDLPVFLMLARHPVKA